MENYESDLVKQGARKAAIIVSITAFLGFSFLLFFPSTYRNPFSFALIFGVMLLAPVGMLGAFLLGWVIYFIFKKIRNKITYTILLIILMITGYILGSFGLFGLFKAMSYTKPYINELDTNRDGRIDRWVYDDPNKFTIRAEIDTDYDGTPDIKEYYKNGDLIKKEYYKNGELIETEKFSIVKNKPR